MALTESATAMGLVSIELTVPLDKVGRSDAGQIFAMVRVIVEEAAASRLQMKRVERRQ